MANSTYFTIGADPTIINSDGLNCLDIATSTVHAGLTRLIEPYIPEEIIEFEIIFEVDVIGIVTDQETTSSDH